MSKYKTEDLKKMILDDKLSYEEIGRRYGISGAAIKKAALRRGIELPIRRKINEKETFDYRKAKMGSCLNCGKEFKLYTSKTGKYCSNACQIEYEHKEFIHKWKSGEINGCTNGFNISQHIRRYVFEKNNYCCEECHKQYTNPYTKKSILQIHHKDGNCLNNKEENLQLLCPNCHAMTENFGSRNKNGNKKRTAYFGKNMSRYTKKTNNPS